MQFKLDVRPSPISGRWYPGNPDRLAHTVDQYIRDAQLPEIEGDVIAILAPHAGYMYSGPVAGYSFAALRGINADLVAVVSPMHHPYPGALLTSDHDAYQTPLGTILVDKDALQTLDDHLHDLLGFGLTSIRRDPEHSLEIELPFLQRALDVKFKLLPVMVRDQSPHTTQALGHALAKTLAGSQAILVASSDLSHFYQQEHAKKLDNEMLRQVQAFDPHAVLRVEEQGKAFACGKGAIAAVLWAAKDLGANHVQLLHYATSGDVTGDYEQVVGYGAAVITRKPEGSPASE
jgi:AmmeMemoRadiSam system protein B